MSAVVLRPATPLDGPFLYELFCASRPELAILPDPLRQMQFRAQSQGYGAQYPNAAHQIVLVGERPVGRLLVDRSPERIHLVDIALLPQVRGQGIGTFLLQGLQAAATESGLPVHLSVFEANPARRLYERLGFQVTRSEPPYLAMHWLPSTGGDA